MGIGGSKKPKVPLDPNNITMDHFEILRVLGKGAFGKVHAVQRRDTKQLFAMKVMDKAQIINERMVDQVLNERYMMAQLHYPLMVNLQFAAQDQVDLFLVVDLMLGGDLRYHMKSGRIFDVDRVRFYTAQTALAINYLHSAGYIHRDIKPDNLLLDAEGYVHVTDFNLSISVNDTRRRGMVGTRSYMAPEVVSREQYNEMIDWWSLGICMYEWAFGLVPFRGSTEEQRDHILHSELRFPSHADEDLKSVISCLLRRDSRKRYSLERLKKHPFFDGFDWDLLEQGKLPAPWKPDTTKANCDGTYDLDEQFQVKKKRPPVTDTCFDTWDWKPGQVSPTPETPRRPRKGNKEESVESDGAISDERQGKISAEYSADFVEHHEMGATSASGENEKKKNKKKKKQQPIEPVAKHTSKTSSDVASDSEEPPAAVSPATASASSPKTGSKKSKASTESTDSKNVDQSADNKAASTASSRASPAPRPSADAGSDASPKKGQKKKAKSKTDGVVATNGDTDGNKADDEPHEDASDVPPVASASTPKQKERKKKSTATEEMAAEAPPSPKSPERSKSPKSPKSTRKTEVVTVAKDTPASSPSPKTKKAKKNGVE